MRFRASRGEGGVKTFQGALKICQEALQSVSGRPSRFLGEGGGQLQGGSGGSEDPLQYLSETHFIASEKPIQKPVRASHETTQSMPKASQEPLRNPFSASKEPLWKVFQSVY